MKRKWYTSIPRGWQCPRCGAVMAPTQAACLWCGPYASGANNYIVAPMDLPTVTRASTSTTSVAPPPDPSAPIRIGC